MLALLLFLLLAGAIVRPRTVVLFSHSLLNQIIKKPKPTPLFMLSLLSILIQRLKSSSFCFSNRR